jgi:hypothetical protein
VEDEGGEEVTALHDEAGGGVATGIGDYVGGRVHVVVRLHMAKT